MLVTLVALLAAAVLLVSLSRRLGVGSILGYLLAGVLIGPSGLRVVTDVDSISEISELGVLMLLFIIGLELRLPRIWAMRRAVFGLGGAQMAVTGAVLTLIAHAAGAPWNAALILGAGLALSSTAIVLPMLGERQLLSLMSGRDAFAVLLFQDIASVPLVALTPLLAGQHSHGPIWLAVLKAAGGVAVILVGGRFVLRPVFAAIGGAKTRELFTATALLVVTGAAAIAGAAGLPLSLGAFAAGVILAESEYRHELQADVEPFEGLLLGFFFMSVGMSANIGLAIREPVNILIGVVVLLTVKIVIAFGLGRIRGQIMPTAVRFALALPQGSEFGFVLFGAAVGVGALGHPTADRTTLVVALSMLISPVLFALSERFLIPGLLKKTPKQTTDVRNVAPAPVVICGFGRFGQIVGRVLVARGIAFNALDAEAENIDLVRRFGHIAYYGDATRLDLLRAVGADTAKVIVLALPDPAQVLKIAELAREHFPQAKVLARARNRRHAHLLMDLGVNALVRETFFSSLRLTELVLRSLDFSEAEARRTVATFRERDEQMLINQHAFYDDEKQLMQTATQAADELRALFEADTST
ncbi:monovalent cation:proton antiporter-2 (CPA2) family protein [Caulobacter sp. S45]|uniref:monovalent cation:proton antiporter-2 (CPA2) family protein n=1 Tax=Caulobacter sp. S45 TaxID=1641861 RepID=UPI00131E7596|nr:monovalent cation:proton antiporter-2 (CPA2) family protein [Caulobacter sp. S45]